MASASIASSPAQQQPPFPPPDAATFAKWFPGLALSRTACSTAPPRHVPCMRSCAASASMQCPSVACPSGSLCSSIRPMACRLRVLCFPNAGNAEDMYTSEGTGPRRAPSPLLVRGAALGRGGAGWGCHRATASSLTLSSLRCRSGAALRAPSAWRCSPQGATCAPRRRQSPPARRWRRRCCRWWPAACRRAACPTWCERQAGRRPEVPGELHHRAATTFDSNCPAALPCPACCAGHGAQRGHLGCI